MELTLFRKDSTIYVTLTCGLIISISDTGKFDFPETIPIDSGAVALKEYPYTGVINTPPFSTLALIKKIEESSQKAFRLGFDAATKKST